jgi:hypothetical protein
MFVDKRALIAMHQSEFETWERLLAGLSPAQITNPSLPDGLSVKDTMAHLTAWQARTIARLEAALQGHAPHFPPWPVDLADEESQAAVDQANGWILETQRDRPWPEVHQAWRKGYLHFLDLLREIPEMEVRPDGKMAWVAEYQLLADQTDTYDYHHAEHRVLLEAWIGTQAAS